MLGFLATLAILGTVGGYFGYTKYTEAQEQARIEQEKRERVRKEEAARKEAELFAELEKVRREAEEAKEQKRRLEEERKAEDESARKKAAEEEEARRRNTPTSMTFDGTGAAVDAVKGLLDNGAVQIMPSGVTRRTGEKTKTITLPGGATMELIYCPPGSFMMGSPASEDGRDSDETQHRVTLTKGFRLACSAGPRK